MNTIILKMKEEFKTEKLSLLFLGSILLFEFYCMYITGMVLKMVIQSIILGIVLGIYLLLIENLKLKSKIIYNILFCFGWIFMLYIVNFITIYLQ